MKNIHEYGSIVINLFSIKCRIVEGTPTPREHSENLCSLKWAPADMPAVEKLM
ncbi:hypothetical protein [Cytobacillus oceanisediminis]|uniref:hypothetical protein n=1 Tax=Cytobacillus oceanisediminis TaxID=665099 RepID=UPI003D2F870B